MTIDLIWLVFAFAGGAALATMFTLYWARPKSGKQEVVELKQAHDEYRGEVATHFVDTAKLVNEMTDSYKALFDHLQQSAEGLLDEETMRDRLGVDAADVITLSRLGFKSENSSRTAAEAAPSDAEAAESEADSADSGGETAELEGSGDAPETAQAQDESESDSGDAGEAQAEQAELGEAAADDEASKLASTDNAAEDARELVDEEVTEEVAIDNSGSAEGSEAIDPKLASVEAANDSVTERREPQIA